MKISFHSYANKTNFHTKSFTLSLAFIMRFTATRKQPITGALPILNGLLPIKASEIRKSCDLQSQWFSSYKKKRSWKRAVPVVKLLFLLSLRHVIGTYSFTFRQTFAFCKGEKALCRAGSPCSLLVNPTSETLTANTSSVYILQD